MKKIIAGCFCWIIAALVVVCFAFYILANFTQPQQQFAVPGKLVLEIAPRQAITTKAAAGESAGAPDEQDFALWFDCKTTYNGKRFEADAKFPATMQVTVSRLKGQGKKEEVAFVRHPESDPQMQSVGDTERLKLGGFTVTPGAYVVQVEEVPAGVFSVAPQTPSLTTPIFLLMAVGGSSGALGLVLVFFGWRERKYRQRMQRLAAENPDAPADER